MSAFQANAKKELCTHRGNGWRTLRTTRKKTYSNSTYFARLLLDQRFENRDFSHFNMSNMSHHRAPHT